MNNIKFLKIVILLLVLINISTLAFLWLNRPQPNNAVEGFFAEKLEFTPQQKEQFAALKDEHRDQIQALKKSNKELHDAYFDLLKNPNIDSATVKNAASQILKIKEKEELALFYHFKKIRAICDAKQKQKFDEVIKEAARMMAPRGPREGQGPPPGEEGPPPPRM